MQFEQLFLKPGRYHIGGGHFRDFSAAELRRYAHGTKQLLDAGHSVPVLYEHAPPGSDEGAPVQLSARDERARQVKYGCGWLKNVAERAGGALAHVLDITDRQAARQLKEGSVKYTSPELRESWTDGLGRTFRNVIAHVALTHKPRNPDQSAFVPVGAQGAALQFSLADFEEGSMATATAKKPAKKATKKPAKAAPKVAQFADDPLEKKPKPEDDDGDGVADAADVDAMETGPEDSATEPTEPPAAPENPDMPKDTGTDESRTARLDAIKAHLSTMGLGLPSDCEPGDKFEEHLLTALLTAEAQKAQQATEDDSNDEEESEENDPLVEEQPNVMPFSLADAEEGKVGKALAKIARLEAEAFERRLTEQVEAGRMTPAVRDRLLASGSLQFSSDGDLVQTFTPREVADLFDELPEGHALTPQQYLFGVGEETHPQGKGFFEGPDGQAITTDEEAEAVVDKVFGRTRK